MAIYESTHAAQRDWQEIVEYTLEQHGVKQTEKYTAQLLKWIEAMAIGKVITKILKSKNGLFVLDIAKNTIYSGWSETVPLSL